MTEPTKRATSPVRVVETHISVLVFLGDKVYKIHKPVHFDFLDFRDRGARFEDCRREVELNRRLAPDVYLGVADLVMDGQPVEHMVVMRALPEERRLASLLQRDEGTERWLDLVAAVLSSFHGAAKRSAEISASARPSALSLKWKENFEEVTRLVTSSLEPRVETEIRALVARWLSSHWTLLEARVAEGHVCDGHGDLQASDIYCLDDGIRILDCLEFSDRLRWDDVCADVAFLAMDLERLGYPDAAGLFVRAYERHSGHRLPPSLLHLHIALRSYVRAKVACLRSEQSDAVVDSAADLQALALKHLRSARSALVLVGGLPGTGKSTLAAGLAAETGWVLVRSDEVRKRRSPESRAAAYDELICSAREHLEEGESVVLDASWISAEERGKAARLAGETGNELLSICCTCDGSVGADRIRERLARGDDVSEATVAVRNLMEKGMDPWPSAVVIDTSHAAESVNLERAFCKLAPG
jgi:aminoglycoside phosphotransferase family enzyme/predicted kinase